MRKILMKIVILVLMSFFLTVSSPYAKDGFDDGNDWNSWERGMKIGYIQGFVSASFFIMVENAGPVEFMKVEKYRYGEPKAFNIIEEKMKKMERYCIPDESTKRMTFGQIIDGLDSFYKDFNNRNITIGTAIYIIKKQIKGDSDEEIETIVSFYRRHSLVWQPSSMDKKPYKDKYGQEKIVSFP